MKKNDVYEIILKVFGLYCIWVLIKDFHVLFSPGCSFSVQSFTYIIINALLALICLYATEGVMKVLNLSGSKETH